MLPSQIMEPFRNVLPFSSDRPNLSTTLGSIEVFQGMPIQKLDLSKCKNLTGKGLKSQGAGCSNLRCCPKATNYGTLLGMFFLSPLTDSTSPPTTLGSIEVFQGMPIQKLDLYFCQNLTGEDRKSQGLGCSNLRCCPRATLKSGHRY